MLIYICRFKRDALYRTTVYHRTLYICKIWPRLYTPIAMSVYTSYGGCGAVARLRVSGPICHCYRAVTRGAAAEGPPPPLSKSVGFAPLPLLCGACC